MSHLQSPDHTKGAVIAEPGLQKQIQWELERSGYADIKKVTSSLNEGIVILRGCVSSFYRKQMAQTIVRRIQGVTEIDNRLSVVDTRAS